MKIEHREEVTQSKQIKGYIILSEEQVKGIIEDYLKGKGYEPIKVNLCTNWRKTTDDGWGTPIATYSYFEKAEIEFREREGV